MNVDLRALPLGQKLGEYEIEGILGQGAFGITYLAKDVMLRRKYAIKEYYPREYAVRDSTLTVKAAGSKEDRDTYSWGLERFLDEARILARFDDQNIIGVRRFFEANGTAYLVMDYCEGESLDQIVKAVGPLPFERLSKLILPLLNGLARVHSSNFLHRDIKPANIFVRHDGSPVLLDFGAARHEVVSHSKSVTSLATPGYGAVEQYSTHGRQGPWTDIYGMGATLYRVITGVKPQDAPGRMLNDELVPAVIKAKGRYPEALLRAIDAAMQVYPEKRPQTIEQWRSMFDFSLSKQGRYEPTLDARPLTNPNTHQTVVTAPEKFDDLEKSVNATDQEPSASNVNGTRNSKRMSLTHISYIIVSAVVGIGLLYMLISPSNEKGPSAQAVKPTKVTTDANEKPAVTTSTGASTHNSPGDTFNLFNRTLQVPRIGITSALNEAETRWCIYEGVRIGIIETKGTRNTPNQAELAKFKSGCAKRSPDEVAKSKISTELTDSELKILKGMQAL